VDRLVAGESIKRQTRRKAHNQSGDCCSRSRSSAHPQPLPKKKKNLHLQKNHPSGTDSGAVYGTACPTLERYCTARTGGGRVEGLAPLRGGAVAVASRASLTVHAPGGRALAAFRPPDPAAAGFTCVAPLPGSGGHVVVAGRAGAPLVTMDLSRAGSKARGGFVSETSAAAAPNGAAALAAAPRGLLAVGTADGRVLLLDPRAGWRPVADVAAHGAAVLAADCCRDLLATAGAVAVRGGAAGGGGGALAADPIVRVFDVRSSAPRPLGSVHFAPRAIDLKFHPHIYGTLLLASANGVVALADVAGSSGGGEGVFSLCSLRLFSVAFRLPPPLVPLFSLPPPHVRKTSDKPATRPTRHIARPLSSRPRSGPRRPPDADRHGGRPTDLLRRRALGRPRRRGLGRWLRPPARPRRR